MENQSSQCKFNQKFTSDCRVRDSLMVQENRNKRNKFLQEINTITERTEENLNTEALANIDEEIDKYLDSPSRKKRSLEVGGTNFKHENSMSSNDTFFHEKLNKSFDSTSKRNRKTLNNFMSEFEVINKNNIEKIAIGDRRIMRSQTLKKVYIRNSIMLIDENTPKPVYGPITGTKSILKSVSIPSPKKNSKSFLTVLLSMINIKEILKVFGVAIGSYIISYLFFKKLKL
jgi:hypothetical protein